MKIKNILLTSDDGYNSLGIRLLTHILKDKFNLKIAATFSQQSGVGGRMSLKKGGKWREAQVEGVSAFWVKGTPMDAIEAAYAYFKKTPFDLVISGINWGANIGGAVMSSGTFSAAHRALHNQLSPYALVLSWDLPSKYWFKKHDLKEEFKTHLEYPGEIVAKLINFVIKNNFWNCKLLNINFPDKKTRQVKFTKLVPCLWELYPDQINLKKDFTFSYPVTIKNTSQDKTVDTWALKHNFISISPCDPYMLDKDVYNKVKDKELKL